MSENKESALGEIEEFPEIEFKRNQPVWIMISNKAIEVAVVGLSFEKGYYKYRLQMGGDELGYYWADRMFKTKADLLASL